MTYFTLSLTFGYDLEKGLLVGRMEQRIHLKCTPASLALPHSLISVLSGHKTKPLLEYQAQMWMEKSLDWSATFDKAAVKFPFSAAVPTSQFSILCTVLVPRPQDKY